MHQRVSRFVTIALLALSAPLRAENAKAPQPPSPFIQCDGSKGHASGLELAGQILAITATAGLAGDFISKDDGNTDKRLDGLPGAAACDAALRLETNELRRVQLGFARTIHDIEGKDLPAALTSVRAIAALGGTLQQDWAFQQSAGSSIAYLEAVIHARMGNAELAEQAAIRSVQAAPYDLLAATRARAFLHLGHGMAPEKRAVLDAMLRMSPQNLEDRAEHLAWVGDYAAASADIGTVMPAFDGFFKTRRPGGWDALQSVYALMAGNIAESDMLAKRARTEIDAWVAEGGGNGIASAEEFLAFQGMGRLLADKRAPEAAAIFNAHGKWVWVPASVTADMLERLQKALPPAARTGAAAEDPKAIREAATRQLLAALSKEDDVATLYITVSNIVRVTDYDGLRRAIDKVGVKPRFLLPADPKDPLSLEAIDTRPRIYGLPSGEALLLHAALIAKARGKTGFKMIPRRKYINFAALIFGNIGEPGFPAATTYDAHAVFEALSPHFPLPPTR